MFWDHECAELSKLLWKPSLLTNHKPKHRNYFNCNHPDISFNYYSSNQEIDPLIQFKKIFLDNDKTSEKYKLENKLMKKEMARYAKESKTYKSNDDISFKNCLNKHFGFIDKINDKVNKLDGFVRSHSIQILPNTNQKKIIQIWLHDSVSIYNKLASHFTQIYNKYQKTINKMEINKKNKCVELAKLLKSNKEFPLNFQDLRKLKIAEYCKDYYQTPYCIIADIIKEFITNVKSNTTKILKYQITDFQFKHKKFSRAHHSITIESKYTTDKGFYPSIMGIINTNDNDFQWSSIEHDYKLIYNKYTKKYYIHVPKYVFSKKPNIIRNPVAIMDPGEIIFQTLYGLDHVITIGEYLRKPINKRLDKIDDLKSKIDNEGTWKHNKKLGKKTKVKKNKYKKAINKHHEKLKHLQQELHNKTAIYLCKNYDRLITTDFSSKKVSKKEGNLNKMSKRVLGKISHYNFRQRLQNKCQEYGCQYLQVNEAYTSIICCNCGNKHKKMDDLRIYNCIKCKKKMNRDINGAINIFIKNHKLIIK